jgi:polygalacturonase
MPAPGSLWLASDMTFEVGAGVTLKAVTDPSAFPFVYARFEGTMRFGHAGLLNAGMVQSEVWSR